MNWKENWRQIENKYQKAYALWMQFDSPEAKICVTYRDLYDFFDEQGMYVNVRADSIFGQWEYVNLWMWEITTTKEGYVGILEHGNLHLSDFSRTEIEEIAFEKAFEILEEKLK